MLRAIVWTLRAIMWMLRAVLWTLRAIVRRYAGVAGDDRRARRAWQLYVCGKDPGTVGQKVVPLAQALGQLRQRARRPHRHPAEVDQRAYTPSTPCLVYTDNT
eukprot:2251191-Pyramimonas_sp.AAC.2